MRAAVMRDRKLVVADVPVPQPGLGEVLVRTSRPRAGRAAGRWTSAATS